VTVSRATGLGLVSLVGAGPGDPDLLTRRAVRCLDEADLVLYDGLVPDEIVALAARADRLSVARRAGVKSVTQADVIRLMIAGARERRRVVRLKAGDPFVLGRGGEEVGALSDAGIPFEVVPGITTATAAPTLAGIPLTHRGLASGFVVVSGHAPAAYASVLRSLPPGAVTVVVLMGLGERAAIRDCLTAGGWHPTTPAAIVMNASRPDQRVWFGVLGDLESGGGPRSSDEAGVIVVGPVVTVAGSVPVSNTFVPEEASWQLTTIPEP
jgi:uroporphyrin-III C-methyltransferase